MDPINRPAHKLTITQRAAGAWRGLIHWSGSPVLGVVALISLPLSAYYIPQVKSAERLVAQLQNELDASGIAAVGKPLPPIVGFDVHGKRLSINLSDSKTGSLIIGVSATCIFCLEMLDTHRRLADAAAKSGRQVYWVSRQPLDEAAASVYTRVADKDHFVVEPTNTTYRALGLVNTPQTILVSAEGIVTAAWKGVKGDKGEIEDEVLQAMGVRPSIRQ